MFFFFFSAIPIVIERGRMKRFDQAACNSRQLFLTDPQASTTRCVWFAHLAMRASETVDALMMIIQRG
jgi:hypothetical protein